MALFLGIAVLPAVAGCVTGIYCTFDLTYLPALKADPMASPDLPGIELIDSWNQGEGKVMGKPSHAEISRTFRIMDQDEAHSVLAEAFAYAESVGWVFQEPPYSTSTGHKTLKSGRARVHVGLGAEDPLHDPEGPRVLRITITNLEYVFPAGAMPIENKTSETIEIFIVHEGEERRVSTLEPGERYTTGVGCKASQLARTLDGQLVAEWDPPLFCSDRVPWIIEQ